MCRRSRADAGLPSLKSRAMHVHDIDDAGDLARHALTFHLQPVLDTTVIVGDAFQRADQDDVELASALQMMQRE